ncbi:MAG: hypothetical protein IPN17_35565 [Deltaproteobacteria bacterium]|nr:hypothetical protein [Deltaproteobacteria bacterium]
MGISARKVARMGSSNEASWSSTTARESGHPTDHHCVGCDQAVRASSSVASVTSRTGTLAASVTPRTKSSGSARMAATSSARPSGEAQRARSVRASTQASPWMRSETSTPSASMCSARKAWRKNGVGSESVSLSERPSVSRASSSRRASASRQRKTHCAVTERLFQREGCSSLARSSRASPSALASACMTRPSAMAFSLASRRGRLKVLELALGGA